MIKIGFGTGFSAISYYIGWSDLMGFLLVLMLLDFITGIMAGAIQGKLLSKTSYIGILRKMLIILVVIACHIADMVLISEHFSIAGFEINSPIQLLAIIYYIGNELISIVENAERGGAKVPSFIKNRFETMKERGNDPMKKDT